MRHLKSVCIVSIVVAFCACIKVEVDSPVDRPEFMPQPVDADAVGVGVSVKLKGLAVDYVAYEAYFIRLDDGEDILKQKRLIHSSKMSYPYVYRLNAQPGRYAVVAVTFGRGTTYLLSRAIIEQSITTIAPGTFGYLGEYEIETAAADDLQQYYFTILKPLPLGPLRFAGPLTSTRDKQKEREFLKSTDEYVLKTRGGAWSTWIQQQLQTQP